MSGTALLFLNGYLRLEISKTQLMILPLSLLLIKPVSLKSSLLVMDNLIIRAKVRESSASHVIHQQILLTLPSNYVPILTTCHAYYPRQSPNHLSLRLLQRPPCWSPCVHPSTLKTSSLYSKQSD